MEMNVRMLGQPDVTFFVRAVVVQDHVQLLRRPGFGDHLIHKLQKLLPPFELAEGRLHLSGRHLQGRKEVPGTVALISALVSAHDLTTVGLHIAGLALQGLDAGFFIDTNHQRLFWRVEIQSHNIGGFGSEFLVGADAPGALPLQANPLLAENSPHGMHRALERRRHRRTVPVRLSRGRRLFQQSQHPLAKVLAINPPSPRSFRIVQPGQAPLHKTLPPLDHGVRASVASASDLFHPLTCQTAQDDPGSFHRLPRLSAAPSQPFQFSVVLGTTTNCGRIPGHARHNTIYRLLLQLSTSRRQKEFFRSLLEYRTAFARYAASARGKLKAENANKWSATLPCNVMDGDPSSLDRLWNT